MTLINQFMPVFTLSQTDRVAVAADADEAWRVIRALDTNETAMARVLFGLRAWPERVAALLRHRPAPAPRHTRIDDFTRPGAGFRILAEEPGREIVVGAVGKLWQPQIEYASVAAERFAAFDEPGFGVLAWSLRVDPRAAGGSWITFGLRVRATDAASRVKFARYWFLIGRFSHALRRSALKHFVGRLGPAIAENERQLPGDEILAHSTFQKTHAVTLEAPPAQVWPWLVQMGGKRGGWYSYDWLDNAGLMSATKIRHELQGLAEGDVIAASPEANGASFGVLRMEPERLLVLGSPQLLPGRTGATSAPPWQTSWAFVLEPIGAEATRLIVRVRAARNAAVKSSIPIFCLGAAHEVMERRQLANLRRRIEAHAAH